MCLQNRVDRRRDRGAVKQDIVIVFTAIFQQIRKILLTQDLCRVWNRSSGKHDINVGQIGMVQHFIHLLLSGKIM